ncbi:MAG: hypothetical protein Q7U38_17380 [Methylobacter sp.]|nr:hypothetical protein [Methylobacter sp.]MDP3055025.1 hypothetical protein [Methylobacter sp.]
MGLKTRMQGFSLSKAVADSDDFAAKTITPSEQQADAFAPLLLKILSQVELEFKESIHSKLLDILDLSLISGIEEKEARKQIRAVAQKLIDEDSIPLNTQTRHQIIKEIEDDVLGLGPLEALLYDPTIADILVNGYKKIYVERFGKLELTPVRFNDDNHLMKIMATNLRRDIQ